MPESAVLHLTCGKIAAGKTTFARRLAADTGAILIGWDLWLGRLYPVEIQDFDDFLRCSARLRTVVGPHVTALLAAGVPVVLDFPANTPPSRAWARGLADQAGAPHRLHWLDTPEARCLSQLARRNLERPEGSVPLSEAEFHRISAMFVAPGQDEGLTIVRHRPD